MSVTALNKYKNATKLEVLDMDIKEITVEGYTKVVQTTLTSNVKSIISVHNVERGPALGGCRFYSYSSKEEALTDVLRLSEGMSYKSAMADLNLGGGKAVIIGNPHEVKTQQLLQKFGEFVDSLNGLYITAKDVGIEVKDLDIIATKTRYVRGLSQTSGDPSPVTAFGVYKGIKASVQFKWGSDSLAGKRVIIQGLGHVGLNVAKKLVNDGAVVFATDTNTKTLAAAVESLNIRPIGANDWQTTNAEIFCPCALGGILNKQNIKSLSDNGVKIIAGGANNQLLDMVKDGERIKAANILYAPDYIINAGGVINIACEIEGLNKNKAMEKTAQIYHTLLSIYERAARENKSTALVSLQMAREKLGLD